MPRIKFPFFFSFFTVRAVAGSIISRARGHFRATPSDNRGRRVLFDCFSISLSLSFSIVYLCWWAEFSRSFFFFNRFSTSNNPFFQPSPPSFQMFGYLKLYTHESRVGWTIDPVILDENLDEGAARSSQRGKRSFNVVDSVDAKTAPRMSLSRAVNAANVSRWNSEV